MSRALFAFFVSWGLAAVCQAAEIIVTPIPVVSVPVMGPMHDDLLAADTWLRRNVRSGSSIGIDGTYPRAGNGSAFMSGTDGVSKGDMEYFPTGGFGPVNNLSTLCYEWYRDSLSTNPAAQAPALRLQIDLDGDITTPGGGYLIYEPIYNGFDPSVPTNTWTSSGNLDLDTGNFWWFQFGVGADNSNGNSYTRTISDYFDPMQINLGFSALTSASTIVGINFGFGSGWNGVFQGAVDNVKIGIGEQDPTTWNFEASVGGETAPVPEPAAVALWSLLGAVGIAYGVRRSKLKRA